jgi:hypothetical protein
MQSRRVGRAGDDSFVLFEGLLSERQLANARTYVRSDEVQAALDEGILFDEKDEDVGSDVENGPPQGSKKRKRNQSQRKSRIAWLERTRDGDGDDDQPNTSPLVPEWLHARLRLAAKETHAKLGETLCPIGFDSAGRWTPRYEPIQYAEYGPGSHYASCSRWWLGRAPLPATWLGRRASSRHAARRKRAPRGDALPRARLGTHERASSACTPHRRVALRRVRVVSCRRAPHGLSAPGSPHVRAPLAGGTRTRRLTATTPRTSVA